MKPSEHTPAERAQARALFAVATAAGAPVDLARAMALAELAARTSPRPDAVRPKWCPVHGCSPVAGCAWCGPWAPAREVAA